MGIWRLRLIAGLSILVILAFVVAVVLLGASAAVEEWQIIRPVPTPTEVPR